MDCPLLSIYPIFQKAAPRDSLPSACSWRARPSATRPLGKSPGGNGQGFPMAPPSDFPGLTLWLFNYGYIMDVNGGYNMI